MNKVLGMGNALVDILLPLKDDLLLEVLNFPKGSMQLVDEKSAESIFLQSNIKKHEKAAGGSAANTIHALAKLGVSTGFVGKVGKDEWGDFFKEEMQTENITPHLFSSTTSSGRAITLISPDSERTFGTYLGAAVELSADDLELDIFQDYGVFHIEGYLVQNHALLEQALKFAKESNLKVSLDLASFNVVEDNFDFLHRMVEKYVDIIFANEEEGKSFTKLEDENEIIEELAKNVDIAILKIGSRGSIIKAGNEKVAVDIYQASPVDTTGAGDLYAAGFIYGYINNKSLYESGRIGSLLSAKVIEVIGPKMTDEIWESIKTEIKNITSD